MDLNNIKGHCMHCKDKRDMKDVQIVDMRPGVKAAKGKCSVCGTGMYRILPKEEKK